MKDPRRTEHERTQRVRHSRPIVIRTCWFPLEHSNTSDTVAMEIWPRLTILHLRKDEECPKKYTQFELIVDDVNDPQ